MSHAFHCRCPSCVPSWNDFADRVYLADPAIVHESPQLAVARAAAIDAENLRTAALEAAQAAREPFVGFRCDRIGCTAEINGSTSTPERCRALTTRAESRGWQCLHHDGKPLHFCPEHVEPLLPTRRVLR